MSPLNFKSKKTTKKDVIQAIKKAPRYNGDAPIGPKELWNKRVLIFTPSRGLVRHEWVHARYGQIIPTNWSMVDMTQFLSPYIPIGFQLADAQNLMAKKVVEDDYEWIIYIEDDNVIPPDTFRRFNEYMIDRKVPIVSGLYFTKSIPPEPLIYREAGTGYFNDWKMGDLVWAEGVPFGCRLEHGSFVKEAWKNSPEYMVGGTVTRRVFGEPCGNRYNAEKGGTETYGGTTDLAWCKRIMDEKLFEKCGWAEYQKMPYPFLVDTNIFVRHIDQEGKMWPLEIPGKFNPDA